MPPQELEPHSGRALLARRAGHADPLGCHLAQHLGERGRELQVLRINLVGLGLSRALALALALACDSACVFCSSCLCVCLFFWFVYSLFLLLVSLHVCLIVCLSVYMIVYLRVILSFCLSFVSVSNFSCFYLTQMFSISIFNYGQKSNWLLTKV